MRIVGGRWRRRNLASPPGLNTRPMPDRVRKAVFETIGSRWETLGKLPPVRVLDVFAGCGAIGLEALSRGARWCGFVERDHRALTGLRRNLSDLLGDEVADLAQVLRTDAFRPTGWAPTLPHTSIELIFVDPPYRDSRDSTPSGRVSRLLASPAVAAILADDSLVVLRHEAKVQYDRCAYGCLGATDVRRYGSMSITYMERSEGAGAS